MNLRLLLSTILAVSFVSAFVAPADAQEPRPRKKIVYTPRPASDFAFLVPGATTLEEAETTLGDTKWSFRSYLLENTVVLYLELADLPSLYRVAGDRRVEPVEVRVYTAGLRGHDPAYLVFKNGVLLYGHVPVSASEESREKLEARFGKPLEVYTELPIPPVEVVKYSTHILRVPGESSFFYVEERDGPRVEMKVLVAPEAKVVGYTRGDIARHAKP